MRALLDLLRENEAKGHRMLRQTQDLLDEASSRLEVLDSQRGEEELVKSVAVELANLREMAKHPFRLF